MEQWEYEMPADQLVNELVCTAARASASGLVTNVETNYLIGVVVSKLEGKTPPFRLDARVQATRRVTSSCRNRTRTIEGSTRTFTVKRIHYHKGRWLLSFGEIQDGDKGPYLFDSVAFRKAVV